MKDRKLKKILLGMPFAISIYKGMRFCRYYPVFLKEFMRFKSLDIKKRIPMSLFGIRPFLQDRTAVTNFEPHYIYHPAWAARIIKNNNPSKHVDISSTLHFITMLSAFIPVEFYDYRPAFLNLDNLQSKSADLNKLPFPDNSIESISCMHVIEHIGLGRYGDPIDPEGDLKAIKELKRVVAPGGDLLFVVPIGRPKIVFNAHRIYSHESIIKNFEDFELKDFSLVPDNFKELGLIRNADPELVKKQSWGCGCFWFRKK